MGCAVLKEKFIENKQDLSNPALKWIRRSEGCYELDPSSAIYDLWVYPSQPLEYIELKFVVENESLRLVNV